MLKQDNYTEFSIPIDMKWLHLTEEYAKLYAATIGFNERLTMMVIQSVNEACGELFERAINLGNAGQMHLAFNSDAYAMEIAITYNGRIPLNPHKERSFEVPYNEADIHTVNAEALWLYIIKCRMDRVYFDVKGKVHTLRIIKYFRQDGKEKQVWVLGQKPALKPDINIDLTSHTDLDYVGFVQNFHSGKVLRLGEIEMHAVMRFDGQTSIYDIYLDAIDRGLKSSPLVYINLYENLEQQQMLLLDEPQISLWDRIGKKMRNMTYSTPHSDKLAGMFYKLMSPMFTKAGLVLILAMAVFAIYPIIAGYDNMNHMYATSYEIVRSNWWITIVFFAINSLIICVHELSHGAACKKYGGSVPRMGITYYLTSFIFFCDTTTSYNFPKKAQRIAVSVAGPLSTLLIWSLLSWCVYFTQAPAWKMLFLMLFVSSTFSLIMNCNPFLRMDAYYVASDLLGVTNLRSLSFNLVGNKFKKMLCISANELNYPKEKRLWLWAYGIIGMYVTVQFCLFPLMRFISYMSNGVELSVKVFWSSAMLLFISFNLISRLVGDVKDVRCKVFKIK